MGLTLWKMRSLVSYLLSQTIAAHFGPHRPSFFPSFLRSLAVAPPELDGLVVLERGGGDDVLCGVARRAEDDVRVAQQLLHDLLRLQVPDVDLRGLGGRGFDMCFRLLLIEI